MLLEHHPTVGPGPDNGGVSHRHKTGAGLLKPGHEVEQRRLAAARRPDDADELPRRDGKSHFRNGLPLVAALAEHLRHPVEDHWCPVRG